MQKKIGGDRLGSGKKMNVDLHGYERSTFNLNRVWRSTMAAGTLVPFLSELALPGDTWDIDLDADGKTHPTIGPLFGSYKMQLDTFLIPIRLYNGLLHNNMLGIGMNIANVKFPILQLTTAQRTSAEIEADKDIDNSQINPSCILHYLGLKGIGTNTSIPEATRDFQCLSWLMYWEIYKYYYANKSEEIGAVIHTPAEAIIQTVDSIQIYNYPYTTPEDLDQSPLINNILVTAGARILVNYTPPAAAPLTEQIIINTLEHGSISLYELASGAINDDGSGTITAYFNASKWGSTTFSNWNYTSDTQINTGKPSIATFPLGYIDEMRRELLEKSNPSTPVIINELDLGTETPYVWIYERPNGIPNTLSSQEGLALKTYQSDIFNNWILTEWVEQVNLMTRVDTSAGYLELDALNIAKKVYDYMNRVAISGGSFDDWIEVTYDTQKYSQCESPMYMGGLSKELIFQEVVSNTASPEGQPLGTLAGKGVMSNKHKGGKVVIKVTEPSYIMGIVSLTPRIDYSQGNHWTYGLKTLDDLYKPALGQIGFQDLQTENMAWWSARWNNTESIWESPSAGKQPAWINYMTAVNETHGNFAIPENEMWMTLNRRYEIDSATANIKDLTTYIDPSKFNFIFAETQLDAQNFWIQIAIDITARRKMTSKLMPNV